MHSSHPCAMAYRMKRQRSGHLIRCCLLLPYLLRIGTDGFRFGTLKRGCGEPRWATACGAKRAKSAGPLWARNRGQGPARSAEDLKVHTVKELRSFMKARGLSQSGNKAELIQALAESMGLPLEAPEEDDAHEEPLPRRRARQATPENKKSLPSENAPKAAQAVVEEFKGTMPRVADSPVRGPRAETLVLDAEMTADDKKSVGVGTPVVDEREQGVSIGHEDYSFPSVRECDYLDPALGGKVPEGFRRVPQPEQKRPSNMPRLPEPTEDMRRRKVIDDLMERRNVNFDLEEAFYPETYTKSGPVPQGDVYTVYTKKAVRPWDGPHADRAEIHVVVLLSDVYGWEDPYIRSMADHVAEICDAVVLVPDLFRGRPRDDDDEEEDYEAWRASHRPATVSSDIRACVAYARDEFKPTSLALMGFCYGGGKALEEAAAGNVKPDDVVAFYPTRYNIEEVAAKIVCPVAAFFGEKDVLPGATPDDARTLREGLLANKGVRDFQIKLCPGAGHGFVHRPEKTDKQNSEDAMLLATCWLDMYLHKAFDERGGEIKDSSEFGFWELPAKSEQVISSSG